MLNKAQQEAVDCKSNRVLCLAGAGTGKTHTMISRISKLVEDGVDPQSILALTFTNVAAFEMKSRYIASHPDAKIVPEFRTFHSFCYYLLSTDSNIRKHIGYLQVPEVADEDTEKRINREAMIQTGIKMSEKKLYNHGVLSQKEAYDLMLLLKAANRLMKRKNLITFDVLGKSICDMFIENNPLVDKYKKQYKYILADEYQDTDNTQHKFVTSFKDSNIFVVGDALQALFAFRGATSAIIKSLSKDEGWTTIKLTENYRSTKQICNYANRFSKSYADDVYRVAIASEKLGPDVHIASYSPSRSYYNSIPKPIVDEIIRKYEISSGSSAILVRTNKEVEAIQTLLFEKGVPYRSVNSNDDAINLLRCILDDNYSTSWLSTFLSTERYLEYIRRSTINETYSLQDFVTQFKWHTAIRENADKIFKLRKACQASRTLEQKCDDILKIIEFNKLKIDIPSESKLNMKLSDLVELLIKNIEEYQSAASELYVGTVHSVKGLEFDSVYVIGPHNYTWRLDDEDNDNLFYVAVTRAKTNLSIYFAQQED